MVGRWFGNLGGVGGGGDFQPGEAGEIAMIFGASHCDAQPGKRSVALACSAAG